MNIVFGVKKWQKKEGADGRSIVKVLKELGVCEEKYYPYADREGTEPKEGSYENAGKYRIKTYARITNLKELKQSIIQFGVCLIGWLVYKSIKKTGRDGVIPTPNMAWPSNWRPAGGHLTAVVGYDDEMIVLNQKGYIKFKNSWGDWGNRGYGYLSYSYIKNHMLDAFSTTDIIAPEPLTIADLAVEERATAWV